MSKYEYENIEYNWRKCPECGTIVDETDPESCEISTTRREDGVIEIVCSSCGVHLIHERDDIPDDVYCFENLADLEDE